MRAGDALLFSDSLLHGAAARRNPGQRRVRPRPPAPAATHTTHATTSATTAHAGTQLPLSLPHVPACCSPFADRSTGAPRRW